MEPLNIAKPPPVSTTGDSSRAARTNPVAFRFHARALAALGRDLVTNDVVAVMELVKNAYDALATRVDVRIQVGDGALEESLIEISDDGHGMDFATIRDVWFVIATPFREAQPVIHQGTQSRSVTGEKGLGRLSAARLGRDIHVITKTNSGPVLEFSLNWEELMQGDDLNSASCDVVEGSPELIKGHRGTRIRIGGLRSEWGKDKISDLRQNLARLVSPFAALEEFSLRLHVKGSQGKTNLEDIEPPQFMSEPKYTLDGRVDSDGTIRAQYRYRPIRLTIGSSSRDSDREERWADIYSSLPAPERVGVNEANPDCGPFEFEIRAWDLTKDDTRDIAEQFGESRKLIRDAIKAQRGVSVYRDDVLALPKSDDVRDWLGLDLRRVSRVGVRLSTSQIVGYVRITKSANPQIIDKSDREGLVSNSASAAFRQLVTRVVALLEDERHKDRLSDEDTETTRNLFEDLSAAPLLAKLERLRDAGADMADAVEAARAFGSDLDRSRTHIERRFGYYNRLAVIGTIAHLVIHEILTSTTVIGRGVRKAGELAKRVGDNATTQSLELAKSSVAGLEALANRFLPLANRNYKPGQRKSVLSDSFDRCVTMLSDDIRSSHIRVDSEVAPRTVVQIDPAELDAIILNLLTNSLYWMKRIEGERQLRFRSTLGPTRDRVTVSFDDSGPGIEPDDRDQVFWPGVTRRPDGMGMGLTVAAELVEGHGGKMRTVVPGAMGGATFEFDLPLDKRAATEVLT